MDTLTKHKTAKGFQWGSILLAILAAVTGAAQHGFIPPDIAIYVLVVTNLLSAILPGLFKKKPAPATGG